MLVKMNSSAFPRILTAESDAGTETALDIYYFICIVLVKYSKPVPGFPSGQYRYGTLVPPTVLPPFEPLTGNAGIPMMRSAPREMWALHLTFKTRALNR